MRPIVIVCFLAAGLACDGDDGVPTPREVSERKPLPGCGRYENRKEPASDDQRAKDRCFLAAW